MKREMTFLVIVAAVLSAGCMTKGRFVRDRTVVAEHLAKVPREAAVRKAKEHLLAIKLDRLYDLRRPVHVQLIEGYQVRGGETLARRPDDIYSSEGVLVWEVVFKATHKKRTAGITYIYVFINADSAEVQGQGNWF